MVATELVGTAISSDPAFTSSRSAPALGDNPQVKYYSDRNGYTRALVGHRAWRSEFVAVDAKQSQTRAMVAARHVIEDGHPGAHAD